MRTEGSSMHHQAQLSRKHYYQSVFHCMPIILDRMMDIRVELLNSRQLFARRRGPGRQCTARRSSTPPTWRTMRGSPGTEVGRTLVRTNQKMPKGCKGDGRAGWGICLPESLNPVATFLHFLMKKRSLLVLLCCTPHGPTVQPGMA